MTTSTSSLLTPRRSAILSQYWQLPRIGNGLDRVPPQVLHRVTGWEGFEASVVRIPRFEDHPAAFAKIFDRSDLFLNEERGRRLAATIGQDRTEVQTPRLLQVCPDEKALVIEFVDAPRLDSVLRRRYLRLPGDYPRIFESLGAWLASYHSTSRAPADPESLLLPVVSIVDRSLTAAAPALGRGLTSVAQRLLETLLKDLRARPRQSVQIHGDFSLANVLAADHRAHVIDFAYSGPGYAEADLAALWSSLRRTLGVLPFSLSARTRLWESFLEGYGREAWNSRDTTAWDLSELHLLAYSVGFPNYTQKSASWRRKAQRQYQFIQSRQLFKTWLVERARAYGL